MPTTFFPIDSPPEGSTALLLFFDLLETRVLRMKFVHRSQIRPGLPLPFEDGWIAPTELPGDLAFELPAPTWDWDSGREKAVARQDSVILVVDYMGTSPSLDPDDGYKWVSYSDLETKSRAQDYIQSKSISFSGAIDFRTKVLAAIKQQGGSELEMIASAMEFFIGLDADTHADSIKPVVQASSLRQIKSRISSSLRRRLLSSGIRPADRSTVSFKNINEAELRTLAAKYLEYLKSVSAERLSDYFVLFVAGELGLAHYEEYWPDPARRGAISRIKSHGLPDSSNFFLFVEGCLGFATLDSNPEWLEVGASIASSVDAFAQLYHRGGLRIPANYKCEFLKPWPGTDSDRTSRLQVAKDSRTSFSTGYSGVGTCSTALNSAFSTLVSNALADYRPNP